jgi:hypothetical protein
MKDSVPCTRAPHRGWVADNMARGCGGARQALAADNMARGRGRQCQGNQVGDGTARGGGRGGWRTEIERQSGGISVGEMTASSERQIPHYFIFR